MATQADARRCPKCHNTGDEINQYPHKGYKNITMICAHKLCYWYGTTWVYSLNDDGTVPLREHDQSLKKFPKRPKKTQAEIDAMLRSATRTNVGEEEERGQST